MLFVETYAADHLRQLDLSLPADLNAPQIEDSLERYALSGGKRLRPILCFCFAELFDVSKESVAPFARLAEFTHAATLLHDDVIDQAELRRAKPTMNAHLSNVHAVLAGDSLIARIMLEMARLDQPRLLEELAQTVDDLTRGEWLQLEKRFRVSVSGFALEAVASMKTSSLVRWCCLIGPLLKNASSEKIQLIRDFTQELGLLFQLTDDRLDFLAAKNSGKAKFKDLIEGQINLVSFILMQNDSSLSKKIERCWQAQSSEFGFMSQAYEKFGAEIEARIRIKEDNCRELLNQIESSEESRPKKVVDEIVRSISQRSK